MVDGVASTISVVCDLAVTMCGEGCQRHTGTFSSTVTIIINKQTLRTSILRPLSDIGPSGC